MTEERRKKHNEACARWRRNHPERYNECLRRWYRNQCMKPIPGQRWVSDGRNALGLSQAELAQLCGVAQTTISKIERGIISVDGSSARGKLHEIFLEDDG